MSFQDEFDAGAGSGREPEFKVKEGANVIRVLDEPAVIVSKFKGKKFEGTCFEGAPYCAQSELGDDERLSKKWQTWIIDRADGKVKLYFMPYTVAKELRTYLDNPDYKFEGWPMPYDITVTVKNAGTFDAEYSVLPARKEVPLTPSEQAAFKEKTPVAELVAAAKERAKKDWEDKNAIHLDEPAADLSSNDIRPEDIPF